MSIYYVWNSRQAVRDSRVCVVRPIFVFHSVKMTWLPARMARSRFISQLNECDRFFSFFLYKNMWICSMSSGCGHQSICDTKRTRIQKIIKKSIFYWSVGPKLMNSFDINEIITRLTKQMRWESKLSWPLPPPGRRSTVVRSTTK